LAAAAAAAERSGASSSSHSGTASHRVYGARLETTVTDTDAEA